MLTGNSFVIKNLLQMYILFFLKRSFKFGVFFIVIGCSDQKNPESEIDKEIDSNRSTATEVIPVTFDSKDRKLDEILVDFDKPIETFPRITSAESYTDQAGITFRDGIEDPFTGRVTDYFSNGQTSLESSYLDGLPHGLQIKYFESGVRALEATFDEGVLSGVKTRWWDNGQIREEEYWSEGNYFGRKLWDETGRLLKEERVDNFNQ